MTNFNFYGDLIHLTILDLKHLSLLLILYITIISIFSLVINFFFKYFSLERKIDLYLLNVLEKREALNRLTITDCIKTMLNPRHLLLLAIIILFRLFLIPLINVFFVHPIIDYLNLGCLGYALIFILGAYLFIFLWLTGHFNKLFIVRWICRKLVIILALFFLYKDILAFFLYPFFSILNEYLIPDAINLYTQSSNGAAGNSGSQKANSGDNSNSSGPSGTSGNNGNNGDKDKGDKRSPEEIKKEETKRKRSERYWKNKAQENQRSKEYREKHKAELAEKNKKYKDQNRDSMNKAYREYYEQNKEKQRERKRQSYRKDLDKSRTYSRNAARKKAAHQKAVKTLFSVFDDAFSSETSRDERSSSPSLPPCPKDPHPNKEKPYRDDDDNSRGGSGSVAV